MLVELSITHLAIIDHTRIRFQNGLNAITGETGAGKSILLDALGAVLGARVSSDLVRTGESSALVEGQFDLPPDGFEIILSLLEDIGIEHDPIDSLIFTREISNTGRSTARINGRMVPAKHLGIIGSHLVDIHGQSDHLAILNPDEQRRILDRYAGLDLLADETVNALSEWRNTRKVLTDLNTGAMEREQRRDLLQYQVSEIDEISPVIGEDSALVRERGVLQNADALRMAAFGALEALSGDSETIDASTLLRQAEHAIHEIHALDPEAASLAERSTEVVVLTQDLVRDIRDYADSIEGDPERLQWVDDRLDSLQTLKRKYGSTIGDVITFRERAASELAALTADEFNPQALRDRLERTQRDAQRLALRLSQDRSVAAKRLSEAIMQSISDLHMGNSEVEIRVEQHIDAQGLPMDDGRVVRADSAGIDTVTFLIASNKGEALKPIGRIASGGETARIMLAVKSILSDVDQTPTLVFDEIDVGVGGRSGQMVGEKLWSLTDRHQVIVISHLAQIAAFADKHFRITKAEQDGRIVSEVEELNPLSREEELAAMLDGIPATPESLANARVMLQRVHDYRARRES